MTIEFDDLRKEVFTSPWLGGIDTGDAARFLASLSQNRFAALAFRGRGIQPLLQPRGGVPEAFAQKRLMHALHDAGSDFLPLTIDSHSRLGHFDVAEALLRRSEAEGVPLLNGFPLVNHGAAICRDILAELDCPISLRHGTPDARVLVEVALAGGVTEIEGGGLTYSLPYSRDSNLSETLYNWAYVDRLCALHSTPERPIHRESFGPLTATMVPPAMVVAVQILEMLMAAIQGVLSFSVSFGQFGAFEQEAATAMVLRTLGADYCRRFGRSDLQVRLVFHQWMGAFPKDRTKAIGLIAASALTGRAVGADKIVVKTADEAIGLPTVTSNCEAVSLVKYLYSIELGQSCAISPEIEAERELVEEEARAIIETVLDLGQGDPIKGCVDAISIGIIDIPFSPHEKNANRLVTMRDPTGRIRIKDAGRVPVPRECLIREAELLSFRKEGNRAFADLLLKDIMVMTDVSL